ncbi:MAG: OmpH family outer membrane protein [Acidobacteriales bacterium]|nr:OmpH family outer membrane protein [Terriglobales bacterium]
MIRFSSIGGLLAAAAILCPATTLLAQSKVAIVNIQKAVVETAEIKKAQTEMESKYRPRQAQMEKLQGEIRQIQQQLQSMTGKLTPSAEQDLNIQAQRKQKDLQRLGEDLQADVDRERNDVLGKAAQRMQDVVKKLAEAKALDVVVDVNSTIYFKPALDVTTEAIAAYDKAYPAK